ncbi:hypothetical protein EON65_46040 [archaeon]|nr:MAG: hypothetical protein EON65_46040 [archaeon]
MDEVEKKKVTRVMGKRERKPYLLEFSNVKFPAQKSDVFRATLTSADEGVVMWVESKKTKQQWQKTITDIGKCGPAGFPEDAVIAFLKVRYH